MVLAPLGMGRSAAWLSAQHHAQSLPSRKKGQTRSTQTGLLPQARALCRVSLTHSLRGCSHCLRRWLTPHLGDLHD